MISSLVDQNARLLHPHGVEAYIPREFALPVPGSAGHVTLPCKCLDGEPGYWTVDTWVYIHANGHSDWRFEELKVAHGQRIDLLENGL